MTHFTPRGAAVHGRPLLDARGLFGYGERCGMFAARYGALVMVAFGPMTSMHKIRVAILLGLGSLVGGSACDDSTSSLPTAPTPTPIEAAAAAEDRPAAFAEPGALGGFVGPAVDPTYGAAIMTGTAEAAASAALVDPVAGTAHGTATPTLPATSVAPADLTNPRAAATHETQGELQLKASAPTPKSPDEGAEIQGREVTLVVDNAIPHYVDPVPFLYRFRLYNVSESTMVEGTTQSAQGSSTASHRFPIEDDTDYRWNARAELDNHVSPWSADRTFSTPSIAPPIPIRPRNGAIDVWPVVLVVNNGVKSNKVGQITMTFEVATSSTFPKGSRVATRDQVAGPNRTSVRLTADDVTAEETYYWRVIARDDSGVSSDYSDVFSFTVSAARIEPPVPTSPTSGARNVSTTPILLVRNGRTHGPVGDVTMTFELATDSDFDALIDSPTQPAGQHAGVGGSADETSVRPSKELEPSTTYHWRVTARDDRGNSAESSPATFRTGAASMDAIDPSLVTWLHPDSGDPTVVSRWPATSMIQSVTIRDWTAGGICIEHTKRNSWPGAPSRIGHPNLAGNPWIFAMRNGTWYAGTYEWLTPGELCKLDVRECGPNCGHDRPSRELGPHVRVPPLDHTWVPQPGDLVGFMVSTMARHGPEGPLRQRSNIVLMRWPARDTQAVWTAGR